MSWIDAIGPIAGALGGAFGGQNQPQLPPELQNLFGYLMRISKNRLQYAKGIPGSDPQESAALAQAKGLAGQQLGQQYGALQSSLGPGSTGAPNLQDALGRFQTGAGSQLNTISQAMLQSFLQSRQNAYNQAANIAGEAGNAVRGSYQPQPQPDFGGLFGDIGKLLTSGGGGGTGFKMPGLSGANDIYGKGPSGQGNFAGMDPFQPLPGNVGNDTYNV